MTAAQRTSTSSQEPTAESTAGSMIHGYRIERQEPLEHLDGVYYELTHLKTGARHIHIACPEDNHTFGVLFPTVPKDSTGVAHILEHVVLAGSRRFPVRDPFFSMIPRSLKTFMNALTSSDWTMYPFSTRNRKDFFNLLSVYLDAVFFPLISQEAFQQEGHRLEFEAIDDPNSRLSYKGVVFNEMKGSMASPQNVMYRGIGKALFPGLTYEHNSGGEPENIPDLTWEQLRQFHATHYHPSNAYFFTYGNLPMADVLEEIENHALSSFDKIDVDVSIPDVERFSSPVTVELQYPLDKAEDPKKKSQALVAWVTAHTFDSFERLALKVVEEVLLGNAASPLRRALISSGLGDALADGTGFHTDYREAVFGAGLKGIDEQDSGRVQQIVLDTLSELVESGVDDSQVDAAIHQLEFEAREISNQGFPYSLKLFFQLSGAYMYGGDPYRSLQFDADLARLEQERSKGRFIEQTIKRYFVENSHRALVVLTTDQELDDKKTQAELARLAKVESEISDEEKKSIVEQALKLKTEQEAKQDLSSLPTLDLADVPLEFERIDHSVEGVGSARIGLFPQPTNGISYVSIRADFSKLPSRLLDHLPLFSYVVTKMGAGKHDYISMANRIAAYTGGISSGVGIRPVAGNGELRQDWVISGKCLVRNNTHFVEIVRDLLTDLKFDPERLHELIAELRAHKEAAVVQSGSTYAQLIAAAKLSATGRFDERLHGLSQLVFLKDLARLEVTELDGLIADLTAISDHLFTNDGLQICVTCEQRSIDELRELISDAVEGLGSAPTAGPENFAAGTENAGVAAAESAAGSAAESPSGAKHEARTTSVPVSFNAKVFKTVAFAHPDAPALMALGHFMRATYLHREIREKGGAYGAHASFDSEKGYFTFSSYRDPNIAATFNVFDNAVAEVKGGLDFEEVKEAILSACGAVDPLESPDTKGRRRFFDDLSGYTLELREKFKRGLLQLTEDDLIRVTKTYLSDSGLARMATISNTEAVEQANREMGGVFDISPI